MHQHTGPIELDHPNSHEIARHPPSSQNSSVGPSYTTSGTTVTSKSPHIVPEVQDIRQPPRTPLPRASRCRGCWELVTPTHSQYHCLHQRRQEEYRLLDQLYEQKLIESTQHPANLLEALNIRPTPIEILESVSTDSISTESSTQVAPIDLSTADIISDDESPHQNPEIRKLRTPGKRSRSTQTAPKRFRTKGTQTPRPRGRKRISPINPDNWPSIALNLVKKTKHAISIIPLPSTWSPSTFPSTSAS